MEITPRELRDVEIAEAFRGYNREVVNDLLERAAASIEGNAERVRELTERLNAAQLEADRSRETEDILHRTLLLAQRAADEAVAEAQQKSREMMEEAELESHKLLADAQTEAQRRRDEERERLEEEVIDLAARRDTLLADVDALTRYESDARDRMIGVIEQDLVRLRDRDTALPGPVPEVRSVELPAMAEQVAGPETVAYTGFVSPAADDATPEPIAADEPAWAEPAPYEAEPAGLDTAPPDSFDAPAAEDDTPIETYVGSAPDDAVTDDTARDDDAYADDRDAQDRDAHDRETTQSVEVTALFDAEAPEPPPELPTRSPWMAAPTRDPQPEPVLGSLSTESLSTASSATEPATAPGFEMLRPDALDAEVLDDDAFFATLREAVHDDSPLGPRDAAADEDFYGDEGERSSFRDVFRRRR